MEVVLGTLYLVNGIAFSSRMGTSWMRENRKWARRRTRGRRGKGGEGGKGEKRGGDEDKDEGDEDEDEDNQDNCYVRRIVG